MRHACIATCLLLSGAVSAAEPPPAGEYVLRSEAALRAISQATPGAARAAACDALAAASFDLPVLTRAVADGFIWERLGAARHGLFAEALRARLVADCVRAASPGTLTLLAIRAREGGVSVTARLVRQDASERTLVWRLRAGGPWGWQAVDVAADGISLAMLLRDEVRSAYDAANGDADAAMSALARGTTPR